MSHPRGVPPTKPSCDHLKTVTVLAPYQAVLDGVVYTAGQSVVNVPIDDAENWISNGWVVDAYPAGKAR